jgi:ATP-dependent helicase HrpA
MTAPARRQLRDRLPVITYPSSLPITERRDELLDALRDHQVVIVAGETGSGKSTQLPKLCLDLGRGVDGLIGHTQPRRVAARTIAERVAEELGSELGGAVGYTVRFTDRVGDGTLVKVMTDGILLAEIQHDRRLTRYDTLIIDEAHERSLNVDFLLGYLKQLLPRRPDLKIIVTSATIDTARFAEHFSAPVIEVTGRAYPVEIRYRPVGEDPEDDRDQVQAVIDAVDELANEGPGDVLVFLSGEREIHDTADALRRLDQRDTEVLPLYARLSAAEQHRIFQPHAGRRIVLATNVAETSLTVPGVRYVVDAGSARVSRYSHRLKVQRLPIEAISQASANQRAGRCGRVAPGVCIRLYGAQDFADRPAFTEPEILRTNLASVILQMTALGLGDVGAFPFLDPPDPRSVRDGVALLEELGALDPGTADDRRRLTRLGRRLAQIPVDPRLGRMVLEAERNGCVREVMIIASALSIQDPRERPAAAQQAAADAHRRFHVDGSDFLALVKLWDYLRERQKELSSSQFRKLCRSEYLNYLRVREWQDLYSQLRRVAGTLGVRAGATASHPDRVHQSLLAGLLSHLGMREGTTREFRGARGAKFAIVPGSALARKPARWVMAAELVETNRLWGRVAASVQPEWAERLGGHLAKRSVGEPRWDAVRGAAVVTERVTLYGLPIVAGRQIGYDRIDRAAARELFIRHAFVEGDWETGHAILAENRRFVEEVRVLEDRVRRRDHLLDDETLVAFYDERVGADVVSGRHFDRWWKGEQATRPDLLRLTMEVLADRGVGLDVRDYPDQWRQDDLLLPITYRFEPGEPGDGVTVHVPLAVLNRVGDAGFDWQVPGFREELVRALVKSLPKQYRRLLVPIADRARDASERLRAPDATPSGSLVEALAGVVSELAGERVPAGAFTLDRVPDHLRVSFSIEGSGGRQVALGKDLDELRARFRGRTRAAIAKTVADRRTIERSGITAWDVGTLPKVVDARLEGHLVRGYPALVDDGDSVSIRVLSNPGIQERVMRTGVRRLLLLTAPVSRSHLERRLTNEARLALGRVAALSGGLSSAGLAEDCVRAAADRVIDEAGPLPWNEEGFAALRDLGREQLADVATAAMVEAAHVVVALAAVQVRLDSLVAPALQPSVEDARAQLARLVRPGFVTAAGTPRLTDVLRYVRAVDRRLERLAADPRRDQVRMAEVGAVEQRYRRLLDRMAQRAITAEVLQVGWMIEELRVSLFAQVLGTSGPVSAARIQRVLDRLEPGA